MELETVFCHGGICFVTLRDGEQIEIKEAAGLVVFTWGDFSDVFEFRAQESDGERRLYLDDTHSSKRYSFPTFEEVWSLHEAECVALGADLGVLRDCPGPLGTLESQLACARKNLRKLRQQNPPPSGP